MADDKPENPTADKAPEEPKKVPPPPPPPPPRDAAPQMIEQKAMDIPKPPPPPKPPKPATKEAEPSDKTATDTTAASKPKEQSIPKPPPPPPTKKAEASAAPKTEEPEVAKEKTIPKPPPPPKPPAAKQDADDTKKQASIPKPPPPPKKEESSASPQETEPVKEKTAPKPPPPPKAEPKPKDAPKIEEPKEDAEPREKKESASKAPPPPPKKPEAKPEPKKEPPADENKQTEAEKTPERDEHMQDNALVEQAETAEATQEHFDDDEFLESIIAEEKKPSKPKGELQQRISTAIKIIAVLGCALLAGDMVWGIMMVILAMLIMLEWEPLSKSLSRTLYVSGIIIIATAIAASIVMRSYEDGIYYILFVALCVSATDTFAYFGGRLFGHTPLAPSISPNKTLEGLICGMAASAITAIFASKMPGFPFHILQGVLIGAVLGAISQGGDLMESYIKRKAGVKDSGTFLPGHGGVLDRMDGYLTALPFFYLVLMLADYLA